MFVNYSNFDLDCFRHDRMIGVFRRSIEIHPNQYYIKKPLIRQFPFTVQAFRSYFYVTPHEKKTQFNTETDNNRANNELNICFCGSHGDGMWFRVGSQTQTDRRLLI